MAKIHPSAVVDRRAELADDVEIGPGCVVDGQVTIGPGSRLIGHVYIQGPVAIGSGNTLYPFVCIGFEPQHLAYAGETAGVVIGDRNVFRESATVHCSMDTEQPTRIGDENYLMNNSHAAHDVVIGSQCVLVTNALLGGHAQLQDSVTIGGNGGVHQHCRVGRLSMLGAVSKATSDLPPFLIANGHNNVVGVNLVGLRRSGMPREAIDAVRWAFKTLYLSGHNRQVALEAIEQRVTESDPGSGQLQEFSNFVRSSTRGIVPYATTRRVER